MIDMNLVREIALLEAERDHLLMEEAIIKAVEAGVFAIDPNFEWTDLRIQ